MKGGLVFGRVALALMFPTLTLPAIMTIAVLIGHRLFPVAGHHPDPSFLVANSVFWILLGSMTLNGWLILRVPAVRAGGIVPVRLATVMVVADLVFLFWTAAVVWGLGADLSDLPTRRVASLTPVVGWIASMAASLAVLVVALQHQSRTSPERPRHFPGTVRVLAGGYVGVCILAVLLANIPGPHNDGGFWGDVVHWALILLGLPWSWIEAPLAGFVGAMLGAPDPGGVVHRFLLSLAVVLNILLVCRWLLLGRRAARLRSGA